jgi:hypothetical protein
MNFVDEKFAAEKHSACAIARLTHSTKGAIDSNFVTSHRPGQTRKIGHTKLDTQNWTHKIGHTKLVKGQPRAWRQTRSLNAERRRSRRCAIQSQSSINVRDATFSLHLYIDPDAALLHLSLRGSLYFSLLGQLDDLLRLWRPDHCVDPPACNPSGNQSLCAQEILL